MTNGIGRVGWRTFVPTNNPLWDNLKAYFTGDGTANDSKGTNNGVLTNGATYSTGKIGSGFSLDGVNDYVGFASTWFRKSKTEPFTISSWVNSSNHYGTIFSNGLDDGHWVFIYGQLIYAQIGNGSYMRVVSASTIPLNTFKHITVTYNGNGVSGFKIYIDGVSNTVSTVENGLGTGDTPVIAYVPRIGTRANGSYPFAGVIDEVGIWDRVLTASEVTELYNAGAGKQYVAPAPVIPVNTSGLVMYIDASMPSSYAGTGTSITDISQSAQVGTLTNGAGYSSVNGGVFTLDGVNDYINMGNSELLQPYSSRTVQIWAKISPSSVGYLYLTGNSSTGQNQVSMVYQDSGLIGYVCNNAGQYAGSTIANQGHIGTGGVGGFGSNANIWVLYTYSYSSSSQKAYVNGTLTYTRSNPYSPSAITGNTLIGAGTSVAIPMKGSIGSVSIYNRQLSNAEVLQNFNATKSRFGL